MIVWTDFAGKMTWGTRTNIGKPSKTSSSRDGRDLRPRLKTATFLGTFMHLCRPNRWMIGTRCARAFHELTSFAPDGGMKKVVSVRPAPDQDKTDQPAAPAQPAAAAPP